MSQPPMPVFVDTTAFFARFNERAFEHDRALAVFDGISAGKLSYGPLFISRYVLAELATLMRRKVGHKPAVDALEIIRKAESFNTLLVDDAIFERTCENFALYDDPQISFIDHASGVLATAHGIKHVFTFDVTDFRTLGFIVVPDDTGDA